jgi:(1->4)-alpha-D-glucan 1-alpha-D-glucosylmutase
LTLKATMPGVADFYQGTELWDLSLVDPDNRRPVDFSARAALLASLETSPDWRALAASWPDGRIKLALINRLLGLRRECAAILSDGGYLPLDVSGPHKREIIAFARIKGRDAIIVVCGRWFGRATGRGRRWPLANAWSAHVPLAGFSDVTALLANEGDIKGSNIGIDEIFGVLPVALLSAHCS